MSDNQEWIQTAQDTQYIDYVLPKNWRSIRKRLDHIDQQYIKDYRDNKCRNDINKSLKIVVVAQNNQIRKQPVQNQQQKLQLVKKKENINQTNMYSNKSSNDKNSKAVQKKYVCSQNNEDDLKNESHSQNEKSQSEKHKKKNGSKIEAHNRKCWPQMSVYVSTIKINLCFRQIYDISSDILVIPFKTTNFEYYPGNILKQYFTNQKQLLQTTNSGSVNIVSIKEIVNFRYVAFLKIEQSQIDKSLGLGIQSLKSLLILNKNKQIQSVVFPLNQKINRIKAILDVVATDSTFTQIKQLEIYFCCREFLEFQKQCLNFKQYLNQVKS